MTAGAETATGDWVSVTEDEARRHTLYGVGGWLIVIAVGLAAAIVLGTVRANHALHVDLAPLPRDLGLLIATEFAFSTMIVIWSALNLALLFRKSPYFTASYAALLIFALLGMMGDVLAASVVLPATIDPATTSGTRGLAAIAQTAAATVGTAIWCTYLAASRRVNVTFRHRVERPELHMIAGR